MKMEKLRKEATTRVSPQSIKEYHIIDNRLQTTERTRLIQSIQKKECKVEFPNRPKAGVHVSIPIQRMIQNEGINTVYAHNTLVINDANIFNKSLNTLLKTAQVVFNQINWTGMKAIIQDGLPYQLPQDILTSLHNQFQTPRVVYAYNNINHMQSSAGANVKRLLLPKDMEEAPGVLPQNPVMEETCVIQALDSFQVNIPEGDTHTVQDWHNWARNHQLDYRTDSDIIRIYVDKLGYSLVNNKLIAISAINWETLGGNGNYLLSTYLGLPQNGTVAHMIGVVINNGHIVQIHDQQNLSIGVIQNNPNTVYTRYVYKM